MKTSKKILYALVFLVGVSTSTFVHDKVIPLDGSGWAMIANTNQVKYPFTYSVNNDAVIIQLDKDFYGPVDSYGNLDPVVIQFMKISNQATSEIVIREEYIYNSTNSYWKDFHMFLLVGIENPEAGFDPTQTPYGDQLEQVSYSNYVGYNPGTGALPIGLDFATGGQGVSNVLGENLFNPGYRSGYDPIVILTDPDLSVGARFGLKEVPTVPEPMTIVIFLAGLGLWWIKRR